jgi:hypothetical protein
MEVPSRHRFLASISIANLVLQNPEIDGTCQIGIAILTMTQTNEGIITLQV